MSKFPFPTLLLSVAVAGLLALAGCSPKFNWREVQSYDAPYVVMLPAKPSTISRPINLDGTQVTMTMTATEIDDVTFAVGSAELPDASRAQAALNAMKSAMVQNIGGTIKLEKSVAMAQANSGQTLNAIEIEATGTLGGSGQPALLFARFVAKDKRVYQAIVVGREKDVSREAVETFLSSFKLH